MRVFARITPGWARTVFLGLMVILLAANRVGAEGQRVLDLDKAITLALENDSQVLAARYDLEKAKLAVRQEEIKTLPQISLVGEHGYVWDPSQQEQNLTIQLQEVLPTGLRLYGEKTATAVEVSRWDQAAKEKAYQLKRAEVRYNTTVLYCNVLKAKRAVAYREEAAKNAREAAEEAKKQLALGKITKTDQLKAENDLAQANYELEKSRREYALALQKLANQIGVTDPGSLVLDERLPADPLAGLDYRQLKGEALPKRLEVQQAAITVQKAEQALAQAKNQSLPVLKLTYQNRNRTYSYGLDYSFLTGELTGTAAWQAEESSSGRGLTSGLEDLFGTAASTIVLELSYSLDFGSAQNRVQQELYNVESAKKNLEQLYRDLALEIDQAISDYELAAAQLKVKQEALPFYQKNVELAQLKLKLGKATSREVSQAELSLLSAQMEVDNAYCDLLTAAEKVKLALGELYDRP